jgi:energy-coupling factor transport system permease protein
VSLLPAAVPLHPQAPLARRNPVAKLAASLVLLIGLLMATDALTPTLVLAVELACLPLCGVPLGTLLRKAWPLLVATVSLLLGNAVFTDVSTGATVVDLGPLTVTTGALAAGGAVALRLAAMAIPGVLFALTTDPVDLADALVQQLRAPARFAYGALAALRLAPLLAAEWEALGRARRARGLAAGRNPVAGLRLFGGRVFALLVGSVRRGTRLALAMDARGFDARVPRTFARRQSLDRGDVALMVGSVLVVAAATGVSVLAGTWAFVLG